MAQRDPRGRAVLLQFKVKQQTLYFRLVPCVSCHAHKESSHGSHGNPVGGWRWLAEFDFQTSGSGAVGKFCVPVWPWEKLADGAEGSWCVSVHQCPWNASRRTGERENSFTIKKQKNFPAGQVRFAFLMVRVP